MNRLRHLLGHVVAVSLVLACMMLVTAGVAFANAGPHGGYSATTDACAGCHRAHSAGAAKLLISSEPALCFTCHGSAGAGAQTNVMDGVNKGSGGGNLLAGGFLTYKGAGVTSTHSTSGAPSNAWGSGTTWASTYDCAGCHNPDSGLVWPGAPTWGISGNAAATYPGRGQNVTMPLTCTSCHDPHGGRNYRLLQQRVHPDTMQQQDPAGYVLVTSNETGGQNPDQPGYVADYVNPKYKLGLGDWCTGCHFTYQQTVAGSPFNAEDGKGLVTRYRHKQNMTLSGLTTTLPLEDRNGDGSVDQLFCLSCHYAHGTSATMSGQAGDVAPAHDSALLRKDNRGVCEDCHKK
jgi:predicted CXXCH cytochrome family protein